ncbi:MAG TPA: hypothetical protein VMW38_07510 [Terriglobia bacterium]|nr:hypothetical protein [Terriglobia bacterium]
MDKDLHPVTGEFARRHGNTLNARLTGSGGNSQPLIKSSSPNGRVLHSLSFGCDPVTSIEIMAPRH